MQDDLTGIQQRLGRAFISRTAMHDDILITDIVAGALGTERRIGIYRQNVFANLANALADIYPVVKRIVGDVFFTESAHTFIAAHPSRCGDLSWFGGEFADFLCGYRHAGELPYLPDVARLEWLLHAAFHAADCAPLDMAQLAAVAPENMHLLAVGLHPSVALLSSPFPLLQIWQANQPGNHENGDENWQIDWQAPAAHFVVYRPQYEVSIRQLDNAQLVFLAAIKANASLEKACEEAMQQDAQFNLPPFINECVQSRIITNIEIPP